MKIISRSAWGARSPRSRTTTTWPRRTEFVVHHSEGPIGQTPRSIQDFHMDGRGWSDVGYNFLVDHLGQIYEGRGWLVVGAHALDHNTSGIGVCVIGRDGKDITAAARSAVRWLYDESHRRAGRTLAKRCHGELSGNSTSCPGSTLRAWVHAGMLVNGAPTPTPPKPIGDAWPYKAGTLMQRGWTNSDGVRKVQRRLGIKDDGDFGPQTEWAVIVFQRAHGLVPDGIVGPKTWAAMFPKSR